MINPRFREDKISGLILDVKDRSERGINFFYTVLQPEIEDGISVCVVPGHLQAQKNDSGIALLAHKLASAGRVDKVDYLVRAQSVHKLAAGGSRTMSVQRNSLGVNASMSVSGEFVLLIDDVTTTGNSLRACRELLLAHGAARVAMLALGATIQGGSYEG